MAKMEKFKIRQVIVEKPEVQLPKGSQVVSVKHHGAFGIEALGTEFPECWQVVYLEPVGEVK